MLADVRWHLLLTCATTATITWSAIASRNANTHHYLSLSFHGFASPPPPSLPLPHPPTPCTLVSPPSPPTQPLLIPLFFGFFFFPPILLMLPSALFFTGTISMESFLGGSRKSDDESRMAIIGHRGCGKNIITATSGFFDALRPSVMENSILSFNMAAECGVDFVEFDVQVTKDGHPIIFHDDLIIYNDKDNDSLVQRRIDDLTLNEFLSIGYQKDSETIKKELLRKTADGKLTVWSVSVSDSLCTLKEAFQQVLPHVGFNIELKYDDYNPISHMDLKRSIDAILKVVHENAMGRKVFFSSFHPDAAILIRQEQSLYPVLFLTDGVPSACPDFRRNSLDAAIEVCLTGNLQGIVSEVKAIIKNPESVQEIKAAQLALLTYGDLNNLPEILRLQDELKVDGLIVDHVAEMVAESSWRIKSLTETCHDAGEDFYDAEDS